MNESVNYYNKIVLGQSQRYAVDDDECSLIYPRCKTCGSSIDSQGNKIITCQETIMPDLFDVKGCTPLQQSSLVQKGPDYKTNCDSFCKSNGVGVCAYGKDINGQKVPCHLNNTPTPIECIFSHKSPVGGNIKHNTDGKQSCNQMYGGRRDTLGDCLSAKVVGTGESVTCDETRGNQCYCTTTSSYGCPINRSTVKWTPYTGTALHWPDHDTNNCSYGAKQARQDIHWIIENDDGITSADYCFQPDFLNHPDLSKIDPSGLPSRSVSGVAVARSKNGNGQNVYYNYINTPDVWPNASERAPIYKSLVSLPGDWKFPDFGTIDTLPYNTTFISPTEQYNFSDWFGVDNGM